VWRWKDGDNYYVARANALENNVSLYYTEKGRRNQYVDAPVAGNEWHVLRVEFAGAQIRILLDGKQYIELSDSHISGRGASGCGLRRIVSPRSMIFLSTVSSGRARRERSPM
jgi:hypothetical protein